MAKRQQQQLLQLIQVLERDLADATESINNAQMALEEIYDLLDVRYVATDLGMPARNPE